MIWSGIKLMIIGMAVVYAYLALMIMFIKLTANLLRTYTAKEESEKNNGAQASSTKSASSSKENSKTVAVISAAVQEHRAKS